MSASQATMKTTSRPKKLRRRNSTSAYAAIRSRLQLAANCLQTAADGELSKKALHDLRTSCRRAEAALRLCQDSAECRALRWLKRRLKKLRHSCNDARDDDVLQKWVKHQHVESGKAMRRAIRSHRKKLQPAIIKLAERLSNDQRFQHKSEKVIERLRSRERSQQVRLEFGRRFIDELHRFLNCLPANREDSNSLHQLRIVGKRLRYTAELVAEVWPDVELAELQEHLGQLQDNLGAMHDLIVGQDRLQKLTPNRLKRRVRKLVRRAQNMAGEQKRKFWRWWERYPVERMLADTTAEIVTLMRS